MERQGNQSSHSQMLPVAMLEYQEVLVMIGQSKKTVFECWLEQYGSHLEQLAGITPCESRPETDVPSHELRDPRNDANQEH